jgi:hypothetical protein
VTHFSVILANRYISLRHLSQQHLDRYLIDRCLRYRYLTTAITETHYSAILAQRYVSLRHLSQWHLDMYLNSWLHGKLGLHKTSLPRSYRVSEKLFFQMLANFSPLITFKRRVSAARWPLIEWHLAKEPVGRHGEGRLVSALGAVAKYPLSPKLPESVLPTQPHLWIP